MFTSLVFNTMYDLTQVTTEIDKRNSYASMFNQIGLCLKTKTSNIPFKGKKRKIRFILFVLRVSHTVNKHHAKDLISCPRCDTQNDKKSYECINCGWEFGFST